MEPFISIVIPTYNEENFLPRLLRSIKKQTYRNREVIVADANSKDKTREVAESLGARVVEGGAVAVGRNNGAEKAKGEIILFLDADVVLPEPSFLARIISEFEKRKLSVATCLPYPLSEKKIDHAFHRVYNAYTKLLEALMPHTPGFCIIVKKDVHEKVGGFDERVKLAEDHDYAQRAVKFGKFGLLRSAKIPVSIRRFEKDGRLKVAMKYFFCELHMLTMGSVKHDLFNYKFGYEKAVKAEKKKLKGG
jgi:glycosyltransferase involved in cell wall biosynthesis